MAEFSGQLALRAAARPDGRTVLAAQSFRAPFHIGKPYWDRDTRTLLVQVVNPTAGILSGDRLESEIAVDPGAALFVTTPSASRIFRMRGGDAVSRQHFSVAAGAWLEVMPEPLVPHGGSRFRQVTTIDVAAGGSLFFVDQLQAGRIGHGESWAWDRLQLELTVRCAGALVLRERFDHGGTELRDLAAFGGSGPQACFANAILLGPAAGTWTAEISALHSADVQVGLSALRAGGWSLKLVARDSITLRETLRRARALLAAAAPHLACDARKL